MTRLVQWQGRIHEQPLGLNESNGVVILKEHYIFHNKSLLRQQKQNDFYRTLGQKDGMPPQDVQ